MPKAVAQDNPTQTVSLRLKIVTVLVIGTAFIAGCFSHGRTVDARYSDMVFYSGATHYYFVTEQQEEVLAVESRDPGARKIINAETLLTSVDNEGPPGPNQRALGETFRLYFDRNNAVRCVAPLGATAPGTNDCLRPAPALSR